MRSRVEAEPARLRSAIRPEADLLISCARVLVGAETAARVRALLRQGIDWPYLLKAARWHGLTPLLHWHLSASFTRDVPEHVLEKLRSDFNHNARRNVALVAELLRLLKLFQTRGIAAVPFKGPILASTVYGNLALRQFGDIDILVRREDVLRATRLLIAERYRPQFRLSRKEEAALIELRCEHTFVREAVLIDLHWAVTPAYFSFSPQTHGLWERLRQARLCGSELGTLSGEDLLISMCVHGAKHHWEQLNWITDVAEVVRVHQEIDLENIVEHASAPRGGKRMILLGLHLAHIVLGAELPRSLVARVQAEPQVRSLADRVVRMLLREAEPRLGPFETNGFFLRAMENWGDRMRYCVDHISPTPLEWELLRLPGSLEPLYYLVRPLRWVGKYALGALRRLSKGRHPGRATGLR